MSPAPVARVLGINVVVDASWTVIAALVTWILYAELWMSDRDAGAGAIALLAVAGAVAFFSCLLAHELSHSLVAVRRGMRVRRIRLFIFGGVSEIEQEAGTPRDELLVTLAGPAMSLLLAAAFLGLAVVVPSSAGAVDRLLELLAVVNLALGVFNLAPGFPLDGGRVLRALVWRTTGNYRWATTVAVTAGRVLAIGLAAAGVAIIVFGRSLEGVWWIAIGWFLFRAAGASLAQLRIEEALHGLTVGDVMAPSPAIVPGDVTLEEMSGELAPSDRRFVAMVVAAGRVRGMLDRRALRRIPRDRWRDVTAAAAMEPITPAAVVAAGSPAIDLVPRLSGSRRMVVVEQGRVVGLVTAAHVAARTRTRGVVRPV